MLRSKSPNNCFDSLAEDITQHTPQQENVTFKQKKNFLTEELVHNSVV